MKAFVVVSREFPFAGRWYVHAPGPNRPHKIALFDSEEKAQDVAYRINALVNDAVRGELLQAEITRNKRILERHKTTLDLWIDEEVFECGCCGVFRILGTGSEKPPSFPYEYRNHDKVREEAERKLAEIQKEQ